VAPSHQDQDTTQGLGKKTLHDAADNAASVASGVGEGVTGTGDSLPESTTSKPFGKGRGGKETQG
jgi:hypothetical protein